MQHAEYSPTGAAEPEKAIIKVIGVGGGGGNAVSHMYNEGIRGVDFFVCNTDVQALQQSPVPAKLQIGKQLTEGLGAGANPEKGKNAALENKQELRELLEQDTKMLFVTAGMGGGTGTGAAPVIAEIAQELDVLTVGIVTAPFGFEGRPKKKRAELGIQEMRKHCDTVLVILNDKLREIYGKASMKEAFRQADNILLRAAKSIAEIITVPGEINVDFEDVRTVMKNAGAAIMGSATAEGENRARRAAEGAITSPLLNSTSIYGSKHVLLSVVVGDMDKFDMDELEEITSFIQDEAGDDTELIFGTATDPELQDSISVTIIATGFTEEEEFTLGGKQNTKRVFDLTQKNNTSSASTPAPEPKREAPQPRVQPRYEREEEQDFFDRPEPKRPSNDFRAGITDKVVYDLDEAYQDDNTDTPRYQVEQPQNARRYSELEDGERRDLERPAYQRQKKKITSPQNHSHGGRHIQRDGGLGHHRGYLDNVD